MSVQVNYDVSRLYETSSVEMANQKLGEGWRLLYVGTSADYYNSNGMPAGGAGPVYVMGKQDALPSYDVAHVDDGQAGEEMLSAVMQRYARDNAHYNSPPGQPNPGAAVASFIPEVRKLEKRIDKLRMMVSKRFGN